MGKIFYRTRVLTIALAHNIHDIYTAFFAPLLPLLIAKLNIPLSAAAVLQVVRSAPSLLNPLLALIAEKKGVKYFIILTPGISAITMSLIGLASSFAMLFILLFVSGISAAFFHVPSPVIIKDSSGEHVGTGMSWYMVGGELARTIGPLVATAAVSLWSLEETWKLMPPGIVASIILYFKLRNYEPVHAQKQKREKGGVISLLKDYRLFFSALGGFIMFLAAMKTALTLYLPVYLINHGASLWYSGVSLSVLQGFGVLGVFLAGPLSDKIGRDRTLLISALGTVLFMGLFSFLNSIIFLAFLGFFMFASGPVLLAIVQDTDTFMPTFMNGMYMTVNFSVASFVALIIGYLGDTFGLDFVYKLTSFVGIGSIPLSVILPATVRKKSREIMQ